MDRKGLETCFEALRAVSDPETCLNGLKQLRTLLAGGSDDLAERISEQTPDLKEIHTIWEKQALMHEEEVAVELLLAVSEMIQLPAFVQLHTADGTLAEALATSVLTARLRSLHHLLGSEKRGVRNAAFSVLTALVGLGPRFAADLVEAFSFALPQLEKAALPPRQEKMRASFPPKEAHSSWMGPDPWKKPVRASFVSFGLALLEAANYQLLLRLLEMRPMMEGLLLHLRQHPPHVSCRILETVSRKVLRSKPAVAPQLKAQLFREPVLKAIADVVGSDGAFGHIRQLSDAAFAMLLALGTDPTHGLCPPDDSAPTAGKHVLLRLMLALRASELPKHFQLLTAMTGRSWRLAGAFLSAARLDLEPCLEPQWLASMAVVGLVSEHATAHLQTLPDREHFEAEQLRLIELGPFPACLSKAQLSRGLQHESDLTRYVTCCTLRRILGSAGKLLEHLQAAAEAAGGDKKAVLENAQRSFVATIRARSPEIGTIQSVASTLESAAPAPKQEAAEAAAMRATLEREEPPTTTSAAQLTLAALSGVLRFYQTWLSEPASSGGFDAGKLLNKETSAQPAVVQHAVLELLEGATAGGAVVPPSLRGSAALQSLLSLRAAGDGVSSRATRILEAVFAAALGISAADPEIWLWLDRLPLPRNATERVCSTVSEFLSEAVVSVSRRPHELFEVVLESGGSLHSELDFSLLAVAALQQAVRVLGSAKMAPASKAAIAGYVAAVLSALLQTQQRPLLLARTALSILRRAAKARSAKQNEGKPREARISTPGSKRKRQQATSGHELLEISEEGQALASLEAIASRIAEELGPSEAGESRAGKKSRSEGQQTLQGNSLARQPVISIVTPEADSSVAVRVRKWMKTKRRVSEDSEEHQTALLCCTPESVSKHLRQFLEAFGPTLISHFCQTHGAGSEILSSGQLMLDLPDRVSLLEECSLLCIAGAGGCAPGLLEPGSSLRSALVQKFWGSENDRSKMLALRALLFGASRATSEGAATVLNSLADCLQEAEISIDLETRVLDSLEDFLASGAVTAAVCRVLCTVLEKRSPSRKLTKHRVFSRLAASLKGMLAAGAALPTIRPLLQLSGFLDSQTLQTLVPELDSVCRSLLGSSREAASVGVSEAVLLSLGQAVLQGKSPPLIVKGLAWLAQRSADAQRILAALMEDQLSKRGRAPLAMCMGAEARPLLLALLALRAAEIPSPAAFCIAANLVAASPPSRAVFAESAAALIQSAADLSAHARRETIALLLPAASASFHLSEPGPQEALRGLAATLRDSLAAYVIAPAIAQQNTGLSTEAQNRLHSHAMPVLVQTLGLAPLQDAAVHKMLKKLLPETGWPANSMPVSKKARQKAELAACLIRKSAQGKLLRQEALVSFARCCLVTLAEQLRTGPREDSDLVSHLWTEIDGWVGDAVATSRVARNREIAQGLARAVEIVAFSVLRCRIQQPQALKRLRRFLAALLPLQDQEREAAGCSADPGAGETSFGASAWVVLELLIGHSKFKELIRDSSSELSRGLAAAFAAASGGTITTLLPAIKMQIPADAEESGAAAVRREVLELVETLLDLIQQHSLLASEARPEGALEALQGLLRDLLCFYGATLGGGDKALLRALHVLETLIGQLEGRLLDDGPLSCLTGCLAERGFLWGRAAPTRSATDGSGILNLRSGAAAAVEEVDPRRVALTVTHFPETRTLAADEADPEGSPSAENPGAFGYDPAFLLPFAVKALRGDAMRLDRFAASGLLALCLRCLGCGDTALRALAYEAVGLYSTRLSTAESLPFKARPQVEALLAFVQSSVDSAFQQLPAISAVFFAEAATTLLHPQTLLYPAVSKLLVRAPKLSLQEVPLMNRLLSSCSEDHAAERAWLLRLIAAGMQGPLDGDICRKRFVAELLMSLHESPLSTPHLRRLARRCLAAADRSPAFAVDLVCRAGLVPWLARAAEQSIQAAAKLDGLGRISEQESAVELIHALRRLLELRKWKLGSGQLQAFGRALNSICRAVAGDCAGAEVFSATAGLTKAFLQVAAASGGQKGAFKLQSTCQLINLTDILEFFVSAEAAGSSAGDCLPPQLTSCLMLLQPPEEELSGSLRVKIATMAEWAVKTLFTASSGCSALREDAPAILEWLNSLVLRQLDFSCLGAQRQFELAATMISLHASLDFSMQQQSTEAAVTAAFHLLHPLIAASFGVGKLDFSWLAARFSNNLPAHVEQCPSESPGTLLQRESKDEVHHLLGGKEWRFLLGNTLPRMLKAAGLPRVEDPGSSWPPASIDRRWEESLIQRGPENDRNGALELLLMMFRELVAGLKPETTVEMLKSWASGLQGAPLKSLGERELELAEAVGIVDLA